ncbi:unnamed protein product [Acanthoscelides obtectus]|uniref:Uncharacterized protein n=1 Tax=Acanthoscelides obtectus TaxID=200917 RepID=A0A9P0PYI7_ACAOB|nr:unnamed protein product [Acanthoscelides obtectus]CAK1679510.1 hypothetical protein AOBTE_LOCUS32310 [Acanthoscelides obtectus]
MSKGFIWFLGVIYRSRILLLDHSVPKGKAGKTKINSELAVCIFSLQSWFQMPFTNSPSMLAPPHYCAFKQ